MTLSPLLSSVFPLNFNLWCLFVLLCKLYMHVSAVLS